LAFVLPNEAKSGILTQQANRNGTADPSDATDLDIPEDTERRNWKWLRDKSQLWNRSFLWPDNYRPWRKSA
jgi:hypothetical protein